MRSNGDERCALNDFPGQLDLGFAAGAAALRWKPGNSSAVYFERGVATEYKGDVDLVTEADRASEKLIVSRLNEHFPEHGILAKREPAPGWSARIGGMSIRSTARPIFLMDSRSSMFRSASNIGLQDWRRIRMEKLWRAWSTLLFTTNCSPPKRRRGAWLLRSSAARRRLHVSPTAHLQESLLSTGFPSHKRHMNPNIHFYQQLTLRSHGVRRAGAAALDLAYSAAGRVDGFWEFNLNPWDTAAGALLVLEAGGAMLRFDRTPFRLDSQEVLATNGLVTDEILGFFEDMFAGRGIEPVPTPAEFAARSVWRANEQRRACCAAIPAVQFVFNYSPSGDRYL